MEAATTNTTPTTTDKGHRARGALDRELFCPRLQRLLLGAASELGQRGNLAQVVASIERGGVGGGGEDPNLSMLRRLGATDTRGIDGRIGTLRALELQWQQLSAKQQAVALAHYLGTPRAHATIRQHFGNGSDAEAQQGSLAGVVLYRWQLKQAKARERASLAGMGPLAAQLEAVRAELQPLERELAAAIEAAERAVPDLGPAPERPFLPLLRRASIKRQLAPYREAYRKWRQPLREALQWRELAAARRDELRALLPPLQAQQARLCGALADGAVLGSSADDEQALVQLCRSGKLDVDAHLRPAEAEVRALHRAWALAGKSAAKLAAVEWVNEGASA